MLGQLDCLSRLVRHGARCLYKSGWVRQTDDRHVFPMFRVGMLPRITLQHDCRSSCICHSNHKTLESPSVMLRPPTGRFCKPHFPEGGVRILPHLCHQAVVGFLFYLFSTLTFRRSTPSRVAHRSQTFLVISATVFDDSTRSSSPISLRDGANIKAADLVNPERSPEARSPIRGRSLGVCPVPR